MINKLLIITIATILAFISAFYTPLHHILYKNNVNINKKQSISMLLNSFRYSNRFIRNTASTLMSDISTEQVSSPVTPDIDFTQFAPGQIYNGTLLSSKKFGVFVDIGLGPNVLLPKSLMTSDIYNKLTNQIETKSDLSVKIQLLQVSQTNKTLSGKLYSERSRPSLSHIKELSGNNKIYSGKVVNSHEFGLFVEIPELNVEGLVPSSFLPNKIKKEDIKSTYPSGTDVNVKIIEVNVDSKKLVLSMKTESRGDVSVFSDVSPNVWLQGVVTSVANFGIFVRPAGYDISGLVYQTRLPRELIQTLKKISPLSVGSNNKTDIENLFHEGDVVKVRVQSVALDTKKIELSMLPFKAVEDEEDDYVIIEDEEEDNNNNKKKRRFNDEDLVAEDSQSEDEALDGYNPLKTLLWWKGQPFNKLVASIVKSETPVVEEEFKILTESKNVIEGTWRRMFELDMREDEADFTSKVFEQELQELEDDIGELNGLDDELITDIGFENKFRTSIGSHIALASLPTEWKEELEYFNEIQNIESTKASSLRSGKKGEQVIFESLLKDIELDLEKSSNRRKPEPVVEAVVEAVVETVVEAVVEPVVEEVVEPVVESIAEDKPSEIIE